MKVDVPVHPDLPPWFSEFRTEYANTLHGAFGSVVFSGVGWKVYAVMTRSMERMEGIYPSAAEAMQAIVEFVDRQVANDG